jgi:hypothetical protein
VIYSNLTSVVVYEKPWKTRKSIWFAELEQIDSLIYEISFPIPSQGLDEVTGGGG